MRRRLLSDPGRPQEHETVLTRRDFVATSLIAGGAFLTGFAVAGCRPPAAGVSAPAGAGDASRAGGEQLGTLEFLEEGTGPADTPTGAELDGRLFTDLSTLTPDKAVIPTDRFYIRTRASKLLDLRRSWSIQIGTAPHLEMLPVKELLKRSEPQGVHVMECAGNDRGGRFGMLGAADWEGVPLSGILERIRTGKPPSRVLVSGFDRYSRPPSSHSVPGCTWIFSTEEIASSGAFLATGMNGKPLTTDHGGPVRLYVPGWYGCACVKWVDRIQLVDDDAEATSQMAEFASRTGQTGSPRLARDYEPAVIDPAAMPVRIEKWRVNGRMEYRVAGITWGGPQPGKDWEIRFGADAPYVPVERVLPGDRAAWGSWTHTWRPQAPGRYTIRLRVPSSGARTRRLDEGFYSRTVEVVEV